MVKAAWTAPTAAAGSVKNMPDDFRVSITNPPGKDAYPISSFTWLLVPAQFKDAAKGKVISGFPELDAEAGRTWLSHLITRRCPTDVKDKAAGPGSRKFT